MLFGSKKTPEKISPLFLEDQGRRYKLSNGNVSEYTDNGLKHEFNFQSGVMHTYVAESFTYRFADFQTYALKTSVGLKQIPEETLAHVRDIGLRIANQILEAATPDNKKWTSPHEDDVTRAKAFIKAFQPQ